MVLSRIGKNRVVVVFDESVLTDALLNQRREHLADLKECVQVAGINRLDGPITDLALCHLD